MNAVEMRLRILLGVVLIAGLVGDKVVAAGGHAVGSITRKELIDAVSRELSVGIDKVIFLQGNGEPDNKFIDAHKRDYEGFVKRAGAFKEMIAEILHALQDDTYTVDYGERLKKDTMEFVRANKGLLLSDAAEFESARKVLVKKASRFINQEPLGHVELRGIQERYFNDVDTVAGDMRGLLEQRQIVCPETMVPGSVLAICRELSVDSVTERGLVGVYTRRYATDLVDMGARKMKTDFLLVTGNVYYGREGANILLAAGKGRHGAVSGFVHESLVSERDHSVLVSDLKGSIWGTLYDALHFIYASEKEANALRKKHHEIKRQRIKIRQEGILKHLSIAAER